MKHKFCPFCGSYNLYTKEIVHELGMFTYKSVCCKDCYARGPEKAFDRHIEAWNKRKNVNP